MKTYRPARIDQHQGIHYRHVLTTIDDNGAVWAHFADGSVYPSIYPTETALLAASDSVWIERMILVSE